LEIRITPQIVERNADNSIIFDNLLENQLVLEGFTVKINCWLLLATKCDIDDDKQRQEFIKELIDVKNRIREVLGKINEIIQGNTIIDVFR
jgi:hypothetical protein